MPAVITGIGLVTALGENLATTWDALLAGRCITEQSRAKLPPVAGGRNPRVVDLGLAAAREAMADAAWSDRRVDPAEIALVAATSRGAIDDWLRPRGTGDSPVICRSTGFQAVSHGQDAHATSYGLAEVADAIRNELHLGGPSLLLSSACGTGLHALIRAAIMLETGEASRALVIAAESSMHPLFAASFRRLGVLSPTSAPCRPFDKNRQGFHISEAAAAICLESAPVGQVSNLPPFASSDRERQVGNLPHVQIGSFALGADAFHLTAPRPDGSTIGRLLAQVAANCPVDLFHAHGTGTQLNDAVELAAIDRFAASQPNRPIAYSHKGAIGHTLGAAGLIGVVLSSQMMRQRQTLPNAQTIDPLPTTYVDLPQTPQARPIRHAIVLAAGFGGPQAAIRLDFPIDSR